MSTSLPGKSERGLVINDVTFGSAASTGMTPSSRENTSAAFILFLPPCYEQWSVARDTRRGCPSARTEPRTAAHRFVTRQAAERQRFVGREDRTIAVSLPGLIPQKIPVDAAAGRIDGEPRVRGTLALDQDRGSAVRLDLDERRIAPRPSATAARNRATRRAPT